MTLVYDQGTAVAKAVILAFLAFALGPVGEFLLLLVPDWKLLLIILLVQVIDTLLAFMVCRKHRRPFELVWQRQIAETTVYLLFWQAIHLVNQFQLSGEPILLLGWLPSAALIAIVSHLLLSITLHLRRLGYFVPSSKYYLALERLLRSQPDHELTDPPRKAQPDDATHDEPIR